MSYEPIKGPENIIMPSQAELRQQIKKKLLEQSREDRASRSWAIVEKALKLLAFQRANCVHFYMSLPTEVDTEFLIDRSLSTGKRVVLPITDTINRELHWYEIKNRAQDLKRGALGIFEPNTAVARKFNDKAQCIFVPGMVFDKKNNRIGRGAGFYDKFLSRLSPDVYKVGLAFSFQVLPEIPVNAHDVRLDEVITD